MVLNLPLKAQKAQTVTLTITGEGDENYGYIEIDGVKYWTAQAIVVDVGTEVSCTAINNYSNSTSLITVNGETVQGVDLYYVSPYLYTAKRNVDFSFWQDKGYWHLNITET